jgi:hypothetical protein
MDMIIEKQGNQMEIRRAMFLFGDDGYGACGPGCRRCWPFEILVPNALNLS